MIETGNGKGLYQAAKELDANGDVEGTLILSEMYHNGDYVKQSYKKEVKLLRKAVKMGSPEAKFNFAMAFATGSGVKQSTYKAISMMEQLADDGFKPALDFLYEEECECECCNGGCGAGDLVKCGETLDVVMERFTAFIDDEEFETAFSLASELHEMGIVQGTYALSIMYHNGEGVEQDFEEEVELLIEATEQEFEPAMFHLAMALTFGKGIEQDAETGYEMMADLADDGYEPALEILAEAC